MALGGLIGNGVKVGFSVSSPLSLTNVGVLVDFTFPPLARAKVDKSAHNSIWEKFMPGMINIGDMKLMLLQDLDAATSAAQSQLKTHWLAGTTIYWRVEVPVNRARTLCVPFEFQGFVLNWAPTTPLKEKQVLSVDVAFDDDSLSQYASQAFTIS
jgi:hypothetical protein